MPVEIKSPPKSVSQTDLQSTIKPFWLGHYTSAELVRYALGMLLARAISLTKPIMRESSWEMSMVRARLSKI
jgi:hypothetical protein